MSNSDTEVGFWQQISFDPKQLVSDDLLEKKTPISIGITHGGVRNQVDQMIEQGFVPEEARGELIESQTDVLDKDPYESRKLHPDETDVSIYRSMLEGLEEPLGIESLNLGKQEPDNISARNVSELTEYAVLDALLDERSNFGFKAEVEKEKIGTDEVYISFAGTSSVFIKGNYDRSDDIEPALAGLDDSYEDISIRSIISVGEPTKESIGHWLRSIPPRISGAELEKEQGSSDKVKELFDESKVIRAEGTAENVLEYADTLTELDFIDKSVLNSKAKEVRQKSSYRPEIEFETDLGHKVRVTYNAPIFDVDNDMTQGEHLNDIPEYALQIEEEGAEAAPDIYRQLQNI